MKRWPRFQAAKPRPARSGPPDEPRMPRTVRDRHLRMDRIRTSNIDTAMNPDPACREASTPLEVALAAQRPIDDSPRQPLEVERLLDAHQRRVSVAEHEQFRKSLAPPRPVDPIDELLGELRDIAAEGGGRRR